MSIVKIKYALLMVIFLVAAPSYAMDFQGKFDSKNHPKAKGAWVVVKYPSDWKNIEGDRPNIVQKFQGTFDGLNYFLQLQIRDAGAFIENECKSMSEWDVANAFSSPSNGFYSLNVKKITHETKPGFLYEIKGKTQRIGEEFEFRGRVMSVCKKNLLISLWCMPSRIDKDTQKIISGSVELQKSKPLCDMYFINLVLMDLY